ncbi:MAG TPA: hypothetical protein VFP01_08650 [Propionibacteriaceae bacterium]|nr:hypothetical protein [Propionibacteriaceae bacterium]
MVGGSTGKQQSSQGHPHDPNRHRHGSRHPPGRAYFPGPAWTALTAAAGVVASGLMGILPFIFVLPVIGVVLAIGSPSDHVAHARRIARRPRNAVLDVALPAALAVVVGQPQLALPLVTPFGLDGSGVTVTPLAIVALALPLAMADAKADTPPTGWFLLTRRNLILSLTIVVVVANWYGERCVDQQ